MRLQDRRWLMLLTIFIILCCIGVVLTFPVLKGLNSTIVGAFDPICSDDMSSTIWLRWYFKTNLDTLITNPSVFFHPILLFYPWGFDTYVADGGNYIDVLLTLPLSYLFGFPADYNLFIFFTLVFNAFTAFLLLHEITGRRWISLLAAIPYGFNVFCLDEIAQGRILQAFGPFIPLAMLYIIKMYKGGKIRRWSVLAGFFMALIALSYWFYGCFFLFWLCIYGLVRFIRSPKQYRVKILFRSIAALVIFGAIVLPFFYPFLKQLLQSGTVQGLSAQSLLTEAKLFESSLVDGLTSFEAVAGQQPGMPFFEPTVLVPILLLLVFIKAKKRPVAWMVSLVFFYIMYLGPSLDISWLGFRIPLPFKALATYVPFFSRFLWPNRFLIMFFAALSACMAFALTTISDRWPAKLSWGKIPAYLLVMVMLVYPLMVGKEFPISLVEPPHPFYHQLAQEPMSAVINLPLFTSATQGLSMRFQMIHGQPMLAGPIAHISFLAPGEFTHFLKQNTFLQTLATIKDTETDDIAFNLSDVDELYYLGFRYVLVHKQAFSSFTEDLAVVPGDYRVGGESSTDKDMLKSKFRIMRNLRSILGTALVESEHLTVFEILPQTVP